MIVKTTYENIMTRIDQFKAAIQSMHHAVERFYDPKVADDARENAIEILTRLEANKTSSDDEEFIDNIILNHGV